MKILNPVGARAKTTETAPPLVRTPTGFKLGILTNHWKSMDRIAQRMTVRAGERYAAAAVTVYDIPINGPMAESVERDVLRDCDAAIVGLAN